MGQNKTQPTELAVADFIAAIENDRRRREAEVLLPRYEEWTGLSPVVWGNGLAGKSGSGIIGFVRYHYKYASGREGEYFLTGFSPRKANMVCYIMPGFSEYSDQMKRLGPHRHSVSCLYFTDLAKTDLKVLEEIVRHSLSSMQQEYQWWPR